MTIIIIPDDIGKRLVEFSEKAHLSKDDFVSQVLEEFLEDQEDYLEALETSLRIGSGEEKTMPYEEILRRYKNASRPH